MNYSEFKETVEKEFMNYMPKEYQDRTLDIKPVTKINTTKDAIHLFSNNENEKCKISPCLYVDDMYSDYLKSNDLNAVLKNAADAMVDAFQRIPDIEPDINWENAKSNIVFQVINTERNKERLADLPHRQFQDLSIIYRWIIKTDRTGTESAVINNAVAKNTLGLSEDQLFDLAKENTKRILPPTIVSINDAMRQSFMDNNVPDEVADMMVNTEMPPEDTLWVISNKTKLNGACAMLYDDKLQELAERLNSDLYILPSSVHECLAVSANVFNANELAQMVREVNSDVTTISPEEFLSNNVYHYDKDLRELTLATNAENKSLDDISNETAVTYNVKRRSR